MHILFKTLESKEEGASMASICTPSALTWHKKVIEKAQDFYSQTSWLFTVIITKIKDAGDAVDAAIRSIEVDLLKEALEIFYNWFTWFLGAILALKLTGAGNAFFTANYPVMKAMFLIKFFSFLTTFLATLSRMHKNNIAPLLLMLLFDCGASLLALSMISKPTLWISLISWLCVFGFLGYRCNQELKEQILQIKTWFGNRNPEVPSLPTVTEAAPAE